MLTVYIVFAAITAANAANWKYALKILILFPSVFTGVYYYMYHEDKFQLMKKIKMQEQYLGVNLEKDMYNILMGGIFSKGVEAIVYEDWYLLISGRGALAINKRYITAIEDAY